MALRRMAQSRTANSAIRSYVSTNNPATAGLFFGRENLFQRSFPLAHALQMRLSVPSSDVAYIEKSPSLITVSY